MHAPYGVSDLGGPKNQSIQNLGHIHIGVSQNRTTKRVVAFRVRVQTTQQKSAKKHTHRKRNHSYLPKSNGSTDITHIYQNLVGFRRSVFLLSDLSWHSRQTPQPSAKRALCAPPDMALTEEEAKAFYEDPVWAPRHLQPLFSTCFWRGAWLLLGNI